MHRIQSILSTAQRYGRKVAVSGRSMENMLKVAQELGYLKVKPGTIVDLASIKSLPKNKIVIVSTGSQWLKVVSMGAFRCCAGRYSAGNTSWSR